MLQLAVQLLPARTCARSTGARSECTKTSNPRQLQQVCANTSAGIQPIPCHVSTTEQRACTEARLHGNESAACCCTAPDSAGLALPYGVIAANTSALGKLMNGSRAALQLHAFEIVRVLAVLPLRLLGGRNLAVLLGLREFEVPSPRCHDMPCMFGEARCRPSPTARGSRSPTADFARILDSRASLWTLDIFEPWGCFWNGSWV